MCERKMFTIKKVFNSIFIYYILYYNSLIFYTDVNSENYDTCLIFIYLKLCIVFNFFFKINF